MSKEKLYPPQELLKVRAGDCDDVSMLLGALSLALGYPARLITLGANPQVPAEFSHVYVEVEVPPGSGRWIALEAARPGSQFGLQPPEYFRKRAWSLTEDSYQDLQGATRFFDPKIALSELIDSLGTKRSTEDLSERTNRDA